MSNKKTVVTITGIRPDFIRMRNIFRELDNAFNHIMIHTGQHFDDELSKIFFEELDIRQPDYILNTGKESSTHYEQLSYLAVHIIRLLQEKNIEPDIILFLGDSHSVLAGLPLFKEGYRIGHIEGGMRSYDRRMPEEVNRVVCDYVSDMVFVYTPLYKERLVRENKSPDSIFVVGNTIVELVNQYMPEGPRSKDFILADIHRNENITDANQYNYILEFLNKLGAHYDMPVKLVRFRRALKHIEKHNLLKDKPYLELVGPYGFLKYLNLQYQAKMVVSDSGTCQEECPLLGTPVIIPRLATERPESVENGNSILIGETESHEKMMSQTIPFVDNYSVSPEQLAWLGDGTTSKKIVKILKEKLGAEE